ncbi:hypothetical protein BJX70DRAFT_390708 [Aspergillus crustosus]
MLKIGPDLRSVLGYLPRNLRQKITTCAAFELNQLFAAEVEDWLCSTSESEECLLPSLQNPPYIHRAPFALDSNAAVGCANVTKFNLILFCHSMYGMKEKERVIERTLAMLVDHPEALVVVFHCADTLRLHGLVRVLDTDDELNAFTAFIAGFAMQDLEEDNALRGIWRKVYRAVGRTQGKRAPAGYISFSAPDIMLAFNRYARSLPKLTAKVPLLNGIKAIKNREAQTNCPAAIVRPTDVQQILECGRWALQNRVSLTVIGGSHSGHCVMSNVVAVDMSAFDQVHIKTFNEHDIDEAAVRDHLGVVIVEAGCKSGDVIRKTMAPGLTVPLGSRISVGAGLWLQGGLGHLSRLHGLACDSIIGAVVVSAATGEVLYIGHVPNQHRPAGAIRPGTENDIFVTFKAYVAPTYLTRNWLFPTSHPETQSILRDLDDRVASGLPRNCSADVYLYMDNGRLQLGVSMFDCFESEMVNNTFVSRVEAKYLGRESKVQVMDYVGLFEAEMYMSGMHGGHAGGKTSSFKRCVFLNRIGDPDVAGVLAKAVETSPTALCYLHLLQGSGAVGDVPPDATAFGCWNWEYVCVMTGVWPRDRDGTDDAQSAMEWVYTIANELLPFSSGVYSAELGPNPRDAQLARKAFGQNYARLAYLKNRPDPHGVLPYACPIPTAPTHRVIFLITGETVSVFTAKDVKARTVSISEATKREYAAASGLDFHRLLHDRAYKEKHRPGLTVFYRAQVVHNAPDVGVLFVTGMRDDAPVASFGHLVPKSKVVEVRVESSEQLRRARRGCSSKDAEGQHGRDHRPCLRFNNEGTGKEAAKAFAEESLLPFLHSDLQRLDGMARCIPNFPQLGIEFRHVLNIAQQLDGLPLCTSLLQSHFNRDWIKVDKIVSCEVGGFIIAPALAAPVNVPLVLISERGKLPPPTISVSKPISHISAAASDSSQIEGKIESECDLIFNSDSVIVVDDVLATGETLCAELQLLEKAGATVDRIQVLVVAEFPLHRGRDLLRRRGYGRVGI